MDPSRMIQDGSESVRPKSHLNWPRYLCLIFNHLISVQCSGVVIGLGATGNVLKAFECYY